MPRAEEISDVESVSVESKRKTTSKPSKKKARDSTTPENASDDPDKDDGEEEGDDDDEEYEIEAILSAKKGVFDGGRTGYFVSWKGYGPEHNGWVDERDAGNATGLIEEFWRNQKKKGSRKSLDAKPKSPPKGGRKSLTKEESSEPGSTSAVQKKRARKAKPVKEGSDVEMDEVPAKKKARKSNGTTRTTTPDYYGEPIDESIPYNNMEKWMTTKSWEHIVAAVDTVERTESGGLDVYFTLTDGTRAKEGSALCAERFPQKMILFYQSNLRWKEINAPEDEAVMEH